MLEYIVVKKHHIVLPWYYFLNSLLVCILSIKLSPGSIILFMFSVMMDPLVAQQQRHQAFQFLEQFKVC